MSDETRPRTAAATEAKMAAADYRYAERLRARGWIVGRPDPDHDMSEDVRLQVAKMIRQGMYMDAAIVAHFAGWLGGQAVGEANADKRFRENDRNQAIQMRMNRMGWTREDAARSIERTYTIGETTGMYKGPPLDNRPTIPQIIRTALDKQQEFLTEPAGYVNAAGHHPGCSCLNVDIPCKP